MSSYRKSVAFFHLTCFSLLTLQLITLTDGNTQYINTTLSDLALLSLTTMLGFLIPYKHITRKQAVTKNRSESTTQFKQLVKLDLFLPAFYTLPLLKLSSGQPEILAVLQFFYVTNLTYSITVYIKYRASL